MTADPKCSICGETSRSLDGGKGSVCDDCREAQAGRDGARRAAREGRGRPRGTSGWLIGVALLVGLASILLEAWPPEGTSHTTRVLLALGLAGAVGAGLMFRSRAAGLREKRSRPARAAARYEQTLAPTNTRCGFCHAGFASAEPALRCKGCGSLVHEECGSDLIETPGPLCPIYGCQG